MLSRVQQPVRSVCSLVVIADMLLLQGACMSQIVCFIQRSNPERSLKVSKSLNRALFAIMMPESALVVHGCNCNPRNGGPQFFGETGVSPVTERDISL